ncbi:MAG: HdeD family acid-resistance protein, partial [Nocardioidaceae bacterium]
MRTAEDERELFGQVGRLWWMWLVVGIAWIVIALVVLQFDRASVTTVGVLVGLMFLLSGFQQFAIAAVADRMKWLWALFGVLFVIAGVIALISPENTFAAIADVLGFLFLLVGAFWIIQAFVERHVYELWWLGLIAGIAMVVLAFWTSGQFFITRAYVLLVFAGIWALMEGVTDIVRAFQIRGLRSALAPDERARGGARDAGPL